MNEYMMLFRSNFDPTFQPNPEQIAQDIKRWQDWIGNIAAQNKFVSTGQLSFNGKSLHSDGLITDGPYAEIKEILGGYIIVATATIDEAMEIAKGCPILLIGGKVEVREMMKINL